MIPELGRSPGEGNGYPLQYSCLQNSMDRGARRATVHGLAKSWTRLSDFQLLTPRSWGLGFQHTFSGDAADSLTDVFGFPAKLILRQVVFWHK